MDLPVPLLSSPGRGATTHGITSLPIDLLLFQDLCMSGRCMEGDLLTIRSVSNHMYVYASMRILNIEIVDVGICYSLAALPNH